MVLPFAREHIVRSLTDGILIFDTEERLTEINRTAEKLLSITTTQAVGKRIGEIPEISSIFGKLTSTGKCLLGLSLTETEEEKLVEAEVIPLNDEKGYSVGLLVTLHDITERKQMLDRINAEDRLASIGKLTAGVAHEINNPLAVIKGLAELMIDSDIDHEATKDVIIINEEVDRVSNVVENLLTFARQQTGEKNGVDINAIITRTVRLMSYDDNHSGITIITDLSQNLPLVLGNEMQLREVFVNIISNAENSMRSVNGKGILKISTQESKGRADIKSPITDPGYRKKISGTYSTRFLLPILRVMLQVWD